MDGVSTSGKCDKWNRMENQVLRISKTLGVIACRNLKFKGRTSAHSMSFPVHENEMYLPPTANTYRNLLFSPNPTTLFTSFQFHTTSLNCRKILIQSPTPAPTPEATFQPPTSRPYNLLVAFCQVRGSLVNKVHFRFFWKRNVYISRKRS
ncbi:hypothetical protein CEXT_353081 [Caerostris extrusa]|uniref:Uncharacterized protein n=1 Tax=Caerostris extrusa TaxID=172846 RepID=A0AAV4Q076_CAEEX|nr:hypothetical protein CEXT_353081 [Caerostris extrusa]